MDPASALLWPSSHLSSLTSLLHSLLLPSLVLPPGVEIPNCRLSRIKAGDGYTYLTMGSTFLRSIIMGLKDSPGLKVWGLCLPHQTRNPRWLGAYLVSFTQHSAWHMVDTPYILTPGRKKERERRHCHGKLMTQLGPDFVVLEHGCCVRFEGGWRRPQYNSTNLRELYLLSLPLPWAVWSQAYVGRTHS